MTLRTARFPVLVLLVLSLLLSFPTLAPTAIPVSASVVPRPVEDPIDGDDVIYFVMTDRYLDGDASNNENVRKGDASGYHGGDFKGLESKLDFIKSLGFTAIWLTPVVKNAPGGYHGYWAVDFFQTDPHLGTLDEFKSLVASAHTKGLKVILDIVVNHTSPTHPFVKSKPDWFHHLGTITNWNDAAQVENGDLAGLPDFDQQNPETRAYLMDMAEWWIRETGVDGFRLDTVRHVPKDFWTEFTTSIKTDFPDFYMIGEVFDGDPPRVDAYTATGIDGLVDFPLYYGILETIAKDRGPDALRSAISSTSLYTTPALMGTFIDNHDVPRFLFQLYRRGTEKLHQAIAFQMAYTGIPVVYYGTEVALTGGPDPDNRRDMVFTPNATTDFMKKAIDLRASHPALVEGDVALPSVNGRAFAMQRTLGDEHLVLVLNLSDEVQTVSVQLGDVGGMKSYQNLYEEEEGKAKANLSNGSAGGSVRIRMEPRAVSLLLLLPEVQPFRLTTEFVLIGAGVLLLGVAIGLLVLWGLSRRRRRTVIRPSQPGPVAR